jgi:small subunit ribosomal protein S17
MPSTPGSYIEARAAEHLSRLKDSSVLKKTCKVIIMEGETPQTEVSEKKFYKIEGIASRGETLKGRVVSDKMKKTVIIERDITKYLPKYKKYARTRSHIVAHNPSSINAKVGDMVIIAETRKLSKTKAWMVVEIIPETGG